MASPLSFSEGPSVDLSEKLIRDSLRVCSASGAYRYRKEAPAVTLSVDHDISESRLTATRRIRYEIHGEELQLPLPGLDHDRKLLLDALDRPAIHISAYVQRKLVGAVRINVDTVPAGLEEPLETAVLTPYAYCARLHVLQNWRGSNVMGQIARACFQQFALLRVAAAICHCYRPLTRLYERMGFQPYGCSFCPAGVGTFGRPNTDAV